MRFGFGEILLLLIVVLLLFGRGRISDVMGEFGKGLRSFKKGLKDDGQDEERKKIEDKRDRV
jgi:sec-independent protein translocase protein TatA